MRAARSEQQFLYLFKSCLLFLCKVQQIIVMEFCARDQWIPAHNRFSLSLLLLQLPYNAEKSIALLALLLPLLSLIQITAKPHLLSHSLLPQPANLTQREDYASR